MAVNGGLGRRELRLIVLRRSFTHQRGLQRTVHTPAFILTTACRVGGGDAASSEGCSPGDMAAAGGRDHKRNNPVNNHLNRLFEVRKFQIVSGRFYCRCSGAIKLNSEVKKYV